MYPAPPPNPTPILIFYVLILIFAIEECIFISYCQTTGRRAWNNSTNFTRKNCCTTITMLFSNFSASRWIGYRRIPENTAHRR